MNALSCDCLRWDVAAYSGFSTSLFNAVPLRHIRRTASTPAASHGGQYSRVQDRCDSYNYLRQWRVVMRRSREFEPFFNRPASRRRPGSIQTALIPRP